MKTKAWACIYKNEQGEVYQLRVVEGDRTSTYPVTNSSEKVVRRFIKSNWKNVTILVADVLEDVDKNAR